MRERKQESENEKKNKGKVATCLGSTLAVNHEKNCSINKTKSGREEVRKCKKSNKEQTALFC
jgi:hypothetical protein